jgi:hypothetical protein
MANLNHAPEGSSENRPVLSAQQARQGVTGHNVRYVLAWGIAGVVVAFVVVYLAFVV